MRRAEVRWGDVGSIVGPNGAVEVKGHAESDGGAYRAQGSSVGGGYFVGGPGVGAGGCQPSTGGGAEP